MTIDNAPNVTPAPLGWSLEVDLAVIGSGVAGLTTAWAARNAGLRVALLTKNRLSDSNTIYAQGGIAAVMPDDHDPGDSIGTHVLDTLAAGGGLVDPHAANVILADAPAAITALIEQHMPFDRPEHRDILHPVSLSRRARTREGGHSAARVMHAGGDATGRELQWTLVNAVLAPSLEHPPIQFLDFHHVMDTLRTSEGAVVGVLAIDTRRGAVGAVHAPAVVLATGGAGQLFATTTNPTVATGDGLALALRAGAVLADMEFIQWHPTALWLGEQYHGQLPLITETLRAEPGVQLVDATGARITTAPLWDLAPRDVVAAAIARRMNEQPAGIDDHVFLDARCLHEDWYSERFPTVLGLCLDANLDPTTDLIPVVPAAHFSCGGVQTTVDGRTGVRGLYAVGEVARTGLHGANRLGSNSLLEGLVVGARTAAAVVRDRAASQLADPHRATPPTIPVAPVAPRAHLQSVMTRRVGLQRDAYGLATASAELDALTSVQPLSTGALIEDAALLLAARAVIAAAEVRTETRGCHVRTDHPDTDPRWRRSIEVALSSSGRPMITSPVAARSSA